MKKIKVCESVKWIELKKPVIFIESDLFACEKSDENLVFGRVLLELPKSKHGAPMARSRRSAQQVLLEPRRGEKENSVGASWEILGVP